MTITLRRGVVIATSIAALALVACSGESNPGSTPTGPSLGVQSGLTGTTAFPQRVAASDGGTEIAPGQANMWDLGVDFSLQTGGSGQFDGALALGVTTTESGTTTTRFFSAGQNQTHAELAYFGPEFGEGDGVTTTTTDAGSAVLTPTRYSSLYQRVDLRSSSGDVWLSYDIEPGNFQATFADEPQFFQIVLRDSNSVDIDTAYFADATQVIGDANRFQVPTSAAKSIVFVHFEQRRRASDATRIDNVSIMDDSREFVQNGDFADGLNGWITNGNLEVVRNVTSGTRTLGNLAVTRSFFAPPSALWARYVDVLTNNTATDIPATVSYDTTPGAGRFAVVYNTPGTLGSAISGWDGSASDRGRDFGLIFGDASDVDYDPSDSADATLDGDGAGSIVHSYDVVVSAGSSVAIMNFVLQNGASTGAGAAGNASAQASAIDAEAVRIFSGLPATRTINEFTSGMTQAQLDAVANFF